MGLGLRGPDLGLGLDNKYCIGGSDKYIVHSVMHTFSLTSRAHFSDEHTTLLYNSVLCAPVWY